MEKYQMMGTRRISRRRFGDEEIIRRYPILLQDDYGLHLGRGTQFIRQIGWR
jgi:hypothetical protein